MRANQENFLHHLIQSLLVGGKILVIGCKAREPVTLFRMPTTFLTAEWRKLILANYAVDPDLLKPYIPYGTEPDLWNGTCYVSLVGFMFQNTRLRGFRIPWHINFEEVNLRFYVKHKTQDGWRRGVCFIKEIVPRYALSLVANTFYGEKYVTLPMRHSWQEDEAKLTVDYAWKSGSKWQNMYTEANKVAQPFLKESEEEFITEHYWGYTKLGPQKTSEYGVEHPSWKMHQVNNYKIDVDFELLYGKQFKLLNGLDPVSVMLAEGSEVVVRSGRMIS